MATQEKASTDFFRQLFVWRFYCSCKSVCMCLGSEVSVHEEKLQKKKKEPENPQPIFMVVLLFPECQFPESCFWKLQFPQCKFPVYPVHSNSAFPRNGYEIFRNSKIGYPFSC